MELPSEQSTTGPTRELTQLVEPPRERQRKLNIDGSLVEGEREGSVAGICRDSLGRIVGGFAERAVASSALEIETLALRAALVYLQDRTELRRRQHEQGEDF
ncbi:hypothetical protein NL676_039565 [Syzygium grande]|nr:hypothetical protein NL676_039565 [Syzygium grande]